MLADSIVALATQAQTSPAGISFTTGVHHRHHHHHHHHKHGGCDRDREGAARVKATGMDVDEEGAATLSSKVKTELGEEGVPPVGGRAADAADAKAGKTENSSAGKGAASGGRERAKSPACGVGRAEDEEASASASVH
ncbi:unnamed protein product, partial [Ectocarpus fasciculatus]